MKKNKTLFFTIVTVLVCVIALGVLVACGNGGNKPQNDKKETKYKVSFYPNIFLDDAPSVVEVVKGKTTSAPTVVRSGYLLDGWYTEKDLINKFDFDTPITKNISLYAKWEEEVKFGREEFLAILKNAESNKKVYATAKMKIAIGGGKVEEKTLEITDGEITAEDGTKIRLYFSEADFTAKYLDNLVVEKNEFYEIKDGKYHVALSFRENGAQYRINALFNEEGYIDGIAMSETVTEEDGTQKTKTVLRIMSSVEYATAE